MHELIEHTERKSILTKKKRKKDEADETDTAADRIVNLTQKMGTRSHQPATP